MSAQGRHQLRWYQVLTKPLWGAALLLAGVVVAVLGFYLGTYGVLLGIVAAPAIVFGIWYWYAGQILTRVLVLRESDVGAEWHQEYWHADAVAALNADCFWRNSDSRVAVLDQLDGKYGPFTAWPARPAGKGGEAAPIEVSSADLARALETSASQSLYESKSKATRQLIKWGIQAAIIGGFIIGMIALGNQG